MNLKQAARELGVHYQTAYKLVRSGRLAAVRVGGSYEISDAALARYVAQKEAMRRVPTHAVDVRETESIVDDRAELLDAALAALDATTLSGRGVLDVVAEGLARVLGDLVVVRPLSGDRRWLLSGAVSHADPRRRSVATAEVDAFPAPTTEGHAGVAIATRAPVFVPHVPQDRYREAMPPELVQHLDDAGVHSLICAPAVHGGEVYAIVSVSRDTPGRPYVRDDVAFVTELAAIVGAALVRARSAADGWQRRHALIQGVTRISAGAYAALLREDGFAELVCDGNGTVVAANATAARMRGVSREALIGQAVDKFAEQGDVLDPDRVLERLLVGELAYADAQRTIVRDDGRVRALTAHVGVVRNDASEACALVVVASELAQPELWGTEVEDESPAAVGR